MKRKLRILSVSLFVMLQIGYTKRPFLDHDCPPESETLVTRDSKPLSSVSGCEGGWQGAGAGQGGGGDPDGW